MSEPTVSPVSVVADTIVRTVELGVTITDAALDGEMTVVFADLLTSGPGRCPECATVGVYRDCVERRLTDLPAAGHPMQLRVRVPRYRCAQPDCERVIFAHDTSRLARPGATTTRRCARFVLRRLTCDRVSVAAIARELGRSWDTINAIAVEATTELLAAAAPARLDGVAVIEVDEHRWAHTRHAAGEGFVTVLVDLTPVVDGRGPARLLDLVPGRSAAALSGWLDQRGAAFRTQVKVVAMDGFTGYKNAATAAVPDAVTVMDPFHVVALAGTKLDFCRQRIQQQTLHRRDRTGDPLYRVRRALRTRTELLTARQQTRLAAVFAAEEHAPVQATHWIYQQIIAAYADPDPRQGKALLTRVIDTTRSPPASPPGSRSWPPSDAPCIGAATTCSPTSPTAHPTGPPKPSTAASKPYAALGLRNLINYRIRSLLHSGALAL